MATPPSHTSADLGAVFMALSTGGASLPSLSLTDALPDDVTQRLAGAQLRFQDASGLLQRALLWDTGYVLIRDHQDAARVLLAPVYVRCGLRMADLAPSASYYTSATHGCVPHNCSSESSGLPSFRATHCANAEAVSALHRCGIPTPLEDTASLALHGAGEDPTDVARWAITTFNDTDRAHIPEFWLRRRVRAASLGTTGQESVSYSIHTAASEPAIGQCGAQPSLIIPCASLTRHDLSDGWCRPRHSISVTRWLQHEQQLELELTTLIMLAGVVLLVLIVDFVADHKRRVLRASFRIGVGMPSITSSMMDGSPQQSTESDGGSEEAQDEWEQGSFTEPEHSESAGQSARAPEPTR